MNPRHFWLALYLIANAYAIVYTLTTGEFVGDLDGIQYGDNTVVLVAGIAVLLSYLGLLVVGFNWLYGHFRVSNAPPADTKSQRLTGLVVAGGQSLFFLFNLVFDVNRAGSQAHVSIALYFIWILFPFDSLAPIYCAQAPSSRIRVFNLVIFVISNLARGWSGPLLLVFSIEWLRAYRSGAGTLSKFVYPALVPLGLVLYPIILAAKFYLRAAATDASIGSFVEMLGGLPSPTSDEYALLLQAGIHQLMGRLQLTSNVADLWVHAREIQAAFQNRQFFPFWLEGLHGYVVNRLTGAQIDSIGIYFTSVGDFAPRELTDLPDSIWNTNTGWIGWFIVSPHLVLLYLLYTFTLCYASVRLMLGASRSKVSRDFLWIVWLLYLLPGWLGSFTGFIYAQFVFLGIQRLCRRVSGEQTIAGRMARVPLGDPA